MSFVCHLWSLIVRKIFLTFLFGCATMNGMQVKRPIEMKSIDVGCAFSFGANKKSIEQFISSFPFALRFKLKWKHFMEITYKEANDSPSSKCIVRYVYLPTEKLSCVCVCVSAFHVVCKLKITASYRCIYLFIVCILRWFLSIIDRFFLPIQEHHTLNQF